MKNPKIRITDNRSEWRRKMLFAWATGMISKAGISVEEIKKSVKIMSNFRETDIK